VDHSKHNMLNLVNNKS